MSAPSTTDSTAPTKDAGYYGGTGTTYLLMPTATLRA